MTALALMGFWGSAQEIIFYENFNIPENLGDWRLFDRDRDGENWNVVQGSDGFTAYAGWDGDAGHMVGSFAYNLNPGQNAPLDVDDLVVSPAIDIPADGKSKLSFKIGVTTSDMSDITYQLYIVEEGTKFDPFSTPVDEENFNGQSAAKTKEIDLSAYKGKKVRFYWRHYKTFFQFVLLLDEVKVVKEENLSTQELSAEKFAIYPNPVTETLHIGGQGKIKHYDIHNNVGQLVLTGSTKEIDVKALPQGIYFLTLVDGDNVKQTLKFIKK
ncbi:Por secretion system C-terminal sorting domain-containing protein [Bergeyella porcorum]|uniref:Por secretion system C-terminal sorting domain-containing protein n=2 Tax=Bergeyella porcorum TaxID=1735111 RepID=A0AAU0F072_9FLAO